MIAFVEGDAFEVESHGVDDVVVERWLCFDIGELCWWMFRVSSVSSKDAMR